MRFLFVMDPADKMIPDKDTTFAFIRAAGARRHESLHCVPKDVFNVGRAVWARCRRIAVSDVKPHTVLGEPGDFELAALDAIFLRKDPPFDAAYAHLTRQLDLVKEHTLVVNDPSGVRDANEKLYALHFSEHMPKTLVSSEPQRMIAFVAEVGGRAVIKPLDGAGGSGVLTLDKADRNLRAIVDLLTDEGQTLALVQEYLPAINQGDKRVLMLDGRPLGAILRVPRPDDFRANIHVGGNVERTELTPDEQALVERVGHKLRAAGLWFVGLDLIGGKLIEVNVTSPTGIQELGRLTGTQPEEQVIDWVEDRVRLS